jgi:hypothetical protein
MEKSTFEEACRAKAEVKRILGRKAWLRGIGIRLDTPSHHTTPGFAVQVNTVSSTDTEMANDLASLLDSEGCVLGVKVFIDPVGDIEALNEES